MSPLVPPASTHRSRLWAYAPAALIAVAGCVSLLMQWYHARPLWVDEEMIALNLRDRSLTGLAGSLWLNQSAPLGWLALQHAILREWGSAERALRALPVLLGIATLLLAAWAGRRWMGPLAAAVFVLLCSLGQYISYFPLETKQYSADVFCGLLLPVLTLWALEPDAVAPGPRHTRVHLWWLTAIIAQWFSVAVLFVAPGCVLILCYAAWKRGGWPRAVLTALPGVLFLASFALIYYWSLRYTLASDYLRHYWQASYPPETAGVTRTLAWLAGRLRPLANNPGGSRLWAAFWVAAIAGLIVAIQRSRWVAAVLLVAPLSAFVLSGLRLVPLADRVSLWTIPSLYAAIAIAAGDAPVLAWRMAARRNWAIAAVAVLAAFMAIQVAAGVVSAGAYELSIRPRSKHNLDDRAAVRYLMQMHEPGDVLITSHMGLPALWWYGRIDVAPPNLGREYQADHSPVLRIGFRSGGECLAGEVPPTLDGRRRALIYLGFDSNDPAGLHELVLDVLSRRGRIFAYRAVAEEGIVAAFDLTQKPGPWTVVATRSTGQLLPDVPRPAGCIGFFQEPRW